MSSLSRSETSGLHLDALRYLLDEMDARERTEFESLLASGGAACEALADAVLIQQSARALSGSRPARDDVAWGWRGHRLRTLSLTGTVLAMLAAAAVFVWGPSPPAQLERDDPAVGKLASGRQASAEELKTVAEMWSMLGAQQPALYPGDSEHLSEFDEAADALSQVSVPEWMLTAVGAEREDQQDSEPLMDLEDEERL